MEYLVPCRGYRILVENLARGGGSRTTMRVGCWTDASASNKEVRRRRYARNGIRDLP